MAASNAREVIDLGSEEENNVSIRASSAGLVDDAIFMEEDIIEYFVLHTNRSVRRQDAMAILAKQYRDICVRRATALKGYRKGYNATMRCIEGFALECSSADVTELKQHILDRHHKEWAREMAKGRRALEKEVKRADDLYEDEPIDSSEDKEFLSILRKRELKLRTWCADEVPLQKVFNDIQRL